jgi:hypothetical protein
MAAAILVVHFTPTGKQAPATGTQFVDSKIQTLTAALRIIRDHADAALKEIGHAGGERRALGWKCTGCGHIKHFTRAVPAEVAAPCPKCHNTIFEPS